MGYTTQQTPCSGQFIRGGEFITVGTDKDALSIQAIVPQTPEGSAWELESRGCYIQEISDTGVYTSNMTGAYYYFTAEDTDATDGAGWYVFNTGTMKYEKADRVFTRGQGFIINMPWMEDEISGDELPGVYQTAGEVKLAEKTITNPCSGQFLRNNFRPVPLNIQKIIPNQPEDAAWDFESRGCYIQEISDTGVYTSNMTGAYYYFTAEDTDATDGAGWYVFNTGTMKYEKSNREFNPGAGFILNWPYIENDDFEELPGSITIKE